MVTPAFVQTMAAYNRWQNRAVYAACDTLPAETRTAAGGAFWGSIQGTLSHVLWADLMWMSRLSDSPKPTAGIKDSSAAFPDFAVLRHERQTADDRIVAWAAGVDADWLAGDLRWYSGSAGRELVRSRGLLVTHFFNHQTHHRGQVHCLLTQAGVTPADTDLILLPD
jgi:uncharacterized damage-inducible protein DinB